MLQPGWMLLDMIGKKLLIRFQDRDNKGPFLFYCNSSIVFCAKVLRVKRKISLDLSNMSLNCTLSAVLVHHSYHIAFGLAVNL